jgi:histone H3/H4
MAAEKKPSRKQGSGKGLESMIISKARVKAAVKKCNVGSEFYGALEGQVRQLIARAEERALGNKRKTLRAADV